MSKKIKADNTEQDALVAELVAKKAAAKAASGGATVPQTIKVNANVGDQKFVDRPSVDVPVALAVAGQIKGIKRTDF